MATTSRVTSYGWIQGNDSSQSSRVTNAGWVQINSAGGSGITVNTTAISVSLTLNNATISGGASANPSAISLELSSHATGVIGGATFDSPSLQIGIGINEPTTPGLPVTIFLSTLSLTSTLFAGFTVTGTGSATWRRRGNIDGAGWSNRRLTAAPITIGSGQVGFYLFGMFTDGVIFWKPRFVRFGEIYGGSDEWVKRPRGSVIWNKRATG